jgi:hypothetical protein
LKTECTHIRQLLSEYIDGMLDASEMSAIRGHLHECADCNREYEALSFLVKQLGDMHTVKVPDDFLEKFHKRIEARSWLDKIKEFLSVVPDRIPIEAVAFALTAVLVLSILYFFPAQEKVMLKPPEKNVTELKAEHGNPAVQIARNGHSVEEPVELQKPAAQNVEKRIPVKLALSLTTTQTSAPIPSQSVSYGNSGGDSSGDDPGLFSSEDNSTHKILPIEVNSKIDEMIKSSGGTLISRDYNSDTGYPSHIALEIPASEYPRFISKIENLGSLQTRAPSLPKESGASKIVIQIELSN